MSFEEQIQTLELPKKGPFHLARGVTLKHWLQGLLLPIGVLFGIGLLTYLAFDESKQIFQRMYIWSQGTPTKQVRFRGTVKSTLLIWKEHTIYYQYLDHTGKKHKGNVTFDRFFTKPKTAQPSVRYLQSDPRRSVLSWAYTSRLHGWIFIGILGIIGFLLILAMPSIWHASFAKYTTLLHLVQKGELRKAKLLESKEYTTHGKPTRRFIYAVQEEEKQHAIQEQAESPIQSHTYTPPSSKAFPAQTADKEHLIILFSPETREHRLLLHKGEPLRWS